jgi:chromosomal replication initiation ATPase DnaA
MAGYTYPNNWSNNTTLFAYGQTGAGKTHTIFGEGGDGLIHQIVNVLIAHGEKFAMSYLEIYNERVRDLTTQSETQP